MKISTLGAIRKLLDDIDNNHMCFFSEELHYYVGNEEYGDLQGQLEAYIRFLAGVVEEAQEISTKLKAAMEG